MPFDETKCGVEHEQHAEPDRCSPAVVVRQQRRTDESADANAREQWPQPARQCGKPAAGCGLPNIRDQRRHHEDCRRLRGRHQQPQEADRNCRQTEADHALHEACQREGARGSDKNCGRVHPAAFPMGGGPCGMPYL